MYSKMDEDPSDKTSSYRGDGADTEYGDTTAVSVLEEEATSAVVVPRPGVDDGAVEDVEGIPSVAADGEEEVAAQIGDSQSVGIRPRSRTDGPVQ